MKRYFLLLFISMVNYGVVVLSNQPLTLNNQLDLIFEVMRQEDFLKKLPEEKIRLFNICYERVLVRDGIVQHTINDKTTVTKNMYREELRRNSLCLDSDIQALRLCENKEKTAYSDACQAIKSVVDQQGNKVLHASYYGNTALNYCYTSEIYEQLIRSGVPFQWKVWAYFNPWLASGLVVSGVGAIMFIYWRMVYQDVDFFEGKINE